MLGDLRHAVRRLRNQPGYAAAAILALALGIGCNTARRASIRSSRCGRS